MAGFRRLISREVAGDTTVDKLNRAVSNRRAAVIRLNKMISDFIDAWEEEDEALKEMYGVVAARSVDGCQITTPAEYLRLVADTIDCENEEA